MILGYGARNNIVKNFGVIWNAAKYFNSRRQSLLHSELFIVRLEHLTAHFNQKRQNLATLVPYHKNSILLSVGAACEKIVVA